MSCPCDESYTTTKDTINADFDCNSSSQLSSCDLAEQGCLSVFKSYQKNPMKNAPMNCSLGANSDPLICLCGSNNYSLDFSQGEKNCSLVKDPYLNFFHATYKNGCK